MKRISLVILVLFCSVSVSAQTVEELIAKNIQAHGGLEHLKAVQTRRATAKFYAGSFEAQYVQENKRPSQVREDFTVQRLTGTQAFDGKVGWQIQPFGGRMDPELLGEDDLKSVIEDADMDGPLVDYQEKGNKIEYLGREEVDGSDAYKIKISEKNGDVRYFYLDTDTFLEIKEETQRLVRGAVRETEMILGSYKEVGGVMYPFLIETGPKGSQDRQKLTIEKIEINVPMDDSRFKAPASLRPSE